MRKNIIFNKYYKNLRKDFAELAIEEFMEVFQKFKRLRCQYVLLSIANFFEKLRIPVVEVPIFRLVSKIADFVRWKLYDCLMLLINGRQFSLYGVTCYCGRQGGGKTVGIVELLGRIRKQYPKCIICTNINYIGQDVPLTSWLQLLTIRNGENGVVFVIDEVQNQGLDWTKFPETLLQVVTMQRKQKIKIYLTSQVYKNVVIQLRRQCFDVVESQTFFGRWSLYRCYDAEEYNNILDISTPERKMKLHKKWRYSFVQSNFLRSLYNTNQIVDTLLDFDKLADEETRKKLKQLKEPKQTLVFAKIIRFSERNAPMASSDMRGQRLDGFSYLFFLPSSLEGDSPPIKQP